MSLKLGNFRLSFTDLSLPLGGLPLTFTRTYDTLNATSGGGDFGFGWNLDLFDMDIQVDLDPVNGRPTAVDPELAEIGLLDAWGDGTRLHVRLPDHTTDSFTVVPGYLGDTGVSGFAGSLIGLVTGIVQLDIIGDPTNSGGSSLRLSQNLQVIRDPDTGALIEEVAYERDQQEGETGTGPIFHRVASCWVVRAGGWWIRGPGGA